MHWLALTAQLLSAATPHACAQESYPGAEPAIASKVNVVPLALSPRSGGNGVILLSHAWAPESSYGHRSLGPESGFPAVPSVSPNIADPSGRQGAWGWSNQVPETVEVVGSTYAVSSRETPWDEWEDRSRVWDGWDYRELAR